MQTQYTFLIGIMKINKFYGTVKPVLSPHLKKDQKLVFKTDYRLI